MKRLGAAALSFLLIALSPGLASYEAVAGTFTRRPALNSNLMVVRPLGKFAPINIPRLRLASPVLKITSGEQALTATPIGFATIKRPLSRSLLNAVRANAPALAAGSGRAFFDGGLE